MHIFDGVTYDPDRDGKRLNRQFLLVQTLMADHKWRTLAELSRITGYPEASISARLRDMRKPRFGNKKVNRRYVSNGVWEYQVD